MNVYKRYEEQITEEEETKFEWKNKKVRGQADSLVV